MYLQSIRNLLDHLETTQMGAIRDAGALVATALLGDGVVYCHEIGHSNQNDFLDRAGGLAAVRPFTFSFAVTDPVPECRKNRPGGREVARDLESVRLAVLSSNLRAGDVMLLGSVSGKNRSPVELAKTCREIGVKVVAFTAMTYSSQVESLHPSGKRLYEVADVVIDTGAPYGDAAVTIQGLEVNALPVSGAGAIVAGWMVWETAIELMIAAGKPPTVFQSVNRAGGLEFYKKMKDQYEARGF